MNVSRFIFENNIIESKELDVNEDYYKHGLGYLFFNSMKKFKDNIAQIIVDSDERDTYDNLLQRSVRTAIEMQSRGIKEDDIITICTDNHINTCVPYLAGLFLGARMCSLDPDLSLDDTVYLLKQVSPKMIFHSENATGLIHEAVLNCHFPTKLICFGEDDSSNSKFSKFLKTSDIENQFRPTKVNPTKTAVIFFSSGTTGLPKGIELNHYTLFINAYTFITYGVDSTTCLSFSPFYWISTVNIFTFCIVMGSCRVIGKTCIPENMLHLISKHKITFTLMSSTIASQVVKIKKTKLKDDKVYLKLLGIGGSPISEYNLEKIRAYFPGILVLHGYGQTELGGIITLFNINNKEDTELMLRKGNSCGRPVPGVQYKVVDLETNKAVGPNKIGELRAKAKHVMNGYYNTDSSDAWDEDGWLKTGDLVYYDEDFCFYVVDRIKEMLKFQGWHVEPAKIEGILLTHPGVNDAVVIGIPDDVDGDHPMGIVIRSSDSEVTAEELVKYVEERVSDKQRLRGGVKFVNKFPCTPSGKVKRKVLKYIVLQKVV